MAIDRWAVVYVSMMDKLQSIFCMFLISYSHFMASGLKPTVGLLGELNLQEESLKKHSVLLKDSESKSEDNSITATSNVGLLQMNSSTVSKTNM